jgi:hypothetical protein
MALTQVQSGMLNSDSQNYGFKNRIINGDMRIDQRNAGAAVTTGTYSYAADRFFIANQTDGAFSIQQVTDAPTEFINSFKVTVTTADASLSSSQRFVVNHGLEGLHMADLAYGTASAKTTTLSFWVKSSVTGSYSATLRAGNSSTGAAYSTSYVINAANTWEYKTITIPGSTIGTWPTDNNTWGYLIFNLGIGSDYSITANTWVAGANGQGISSDTKLISTVNATWQVTGIQLEKGSTATAFDYRPYGTELALCQRYFINERLQGYGLSGFVDTTTTAIFYLTFRQPMRADPSLTAVGTFEVRRSGVAGSAATIGSPQVTPDGARVNVTSSSITAGQGCGLTAGSGVAYLQFSAEL